MMYACEKIVETFFFIFKILAVDSFSTSIPVGFLKPVLFSPYKKCWVIRKKMDIVFIV